MYNLSDYVRDLLELNREPLETWDRTRFYTSVAFGLVEELHEFKEDNQDSHGWLTTATKEAGDVLAYVVLVLACEFDSLSVSWKTEELVNWSYLENEGQQFTDVYTAAQTLAGDFKRLFREGTPVSSSVVIMALNTVLAELAPHGITLADVAETNIKKLQDRANRGVMLQGRGNNR